MSDYTIDWSNTNVDGNNTIAGPDGDIHVSVATPQNAEGKEWFVDGASGMLKNWDVQSDNSADITFSQEVTDVKFTLFSVDSLDEITIMTKDADGNPVEVQFEATGNHTVNGNTVVGNQTDGNGHTIGGPQDIEICIEGPLETFWIVFDDGPDRHYASTVAVGDITFNVAPEGDGYVEGGSGDDTINVAYTGDPDGDMIDNGDAIITGEAFNDDIVLAGGGNDFVVAGDGNDEVYGESGNDTLCGNDGDDVLYGGSGADILEGMNDNDVLFGGTGSDTIYGDAGDDIATGGTGSDIIFGGTGEDLLSGAKGNDTINAGSDNDVVYGGGGADSITGGAGDDTLIGGNMSFDGTQDFSDLATGELVEGQYIADGLTITSADPTNPVMVFDTANPTGGDTDLATGNLGNVLILSEDRDFLDPDDNASGGTFNINFEGPASVSSLTLLDADGGAWVKYYDVNGNLLQQVDVTTADNGQHVINTNLTNVGSIEVILGSSGAIDNLSYSINPDDCDTADVISGGAGNDYIEGNAGNDVLTGDDGMDTIFGGAGDDSVDGGADMDTIYGGAGNDNLDGGDGADRIEGGNGNDVIEGGAGDDGFNGKGLYGGAGDDDIFGGDGRDLISGGSGDDEGFGGAGNDEIWMGTGNDTAEGGDGNDWMHGQDGNDELFGGAGDDMLFGEAGDDTLTGGEGADMLQGGDGSDLIFGGAGDTVDGGAGGTDFDVLDLTGQGPFYLEDVVEDSNGNGIDGTVIFVDADGNPTGETLTFTEIEQVIGEEVNRGPDAVDDTAVVDEDGEVTIDVLGNDSDPDGDDLTVTDATSPDGDVTINADGTITFTPDENFNGETTITYTIDDGNGGTDTATVTVTVNAVNDGPVANDDAFEVTQDDAANDWDGNALNNDNDLEGDTIRVVSVTNGTDTAENADPFGATGSPATVPGDNGGIVTIFNGGRIEFDPNGEFDDLDEGETATTTVTYTIQDENGGTDTATVTITVTGTNDEPTAVADVDSTDQDTTIVLDNVLGNDTDPEDHTLTVSEVDGDPANVGQPIAGDNGGLITINADGTASFDPAGDFDDLGTDDTAQTEVTYTISDGNGGTDTTTVTVTVTGTNDAPEATNSSYVVSQDEAFGDNDANAITDNTGEGVDSDVDGDPLTVSEVNGDAANVGAPIAGDNGGEFIINADGSVDFSANGDFDDLGNGETASTTVTYTITDPEGGTDTATVTFTVTGTNDGPVAVDDFDTTDQDTAIVLDNVLDNDSDLDGDDLTVVRVEGMTGNVGDPVAGDNGGLITINADGTASFDPNGEFDALGNGETADTSVMYQVSDGNGGTAIATVTVTVTGTNDAPEANNSSYIVNQDEVFGDNDANAITDNTGEGVDSDVDGDPLTVSEVNGDAANVGAPIAGDNGGEFIINADGSVDFSANGEFDDLGNGETASTTVTYTITDPEGGTDTATVTFTVTGTNDGPVATEDTDATDQDTVITLDNVLGNDTDPEGDDLTVVRVDGMTGRVGQPTAGDNGGQFTINADGTASFDPAGDFDTLGLGETAETTITYTISDGNGGTDTTTVTVTVTGLNDGTVQGTGGDDIINPDIPYVDADGDIVDAGDGILPGDEGTDNDIIEGFGGDDTIQAGAGDDVVFGGADDDSIAGNDGDDELFGGTGDDTVRGGTGDDTVNGDEGMDMLFGGAGNDTLDGGADDDKIEGGSGDDTMFGGDGNDDLWGASGDDDVFGGAGNDTIATAEGNDYVEGGDGDDIIDTSNDENPLTGQNLPDQGYPGVYPADLDPNDDLDTVFGGAGDDSILTGDDDDTIFGGDGNDTIDSGIDDDFVEGGAGNDTIIASEGDDEVYGEDGDDLIYGGLVPGVADDLNIEDDGSNPNGPDLVPDNNMDTLFGGAGNDTIFGADDDDTLFGGTGNDVLDGGIDDDTLYGDDGNDTIIGGQGTDELFGGQGSDTFLGGNGGDVVVGGEDPDVDGDGNSDDVDVLDLTGSGVATIDYDAGDPEAGTVTFLDGSTMTFSEIENVIPCFTPGTTIATPKGERLVEELREGDRIITRDNGIQEIRWTGRKEMSGKALLANPHLKPILVRAGSLGNGLPERDMLVSPNHRMLVASEKTQLYFEEREVLAAAKHLVGSEGIHAVDVMGTAYIHFMFDRHEVVLSNGAWTESFQPGDYSLKGIGNSQRNEIFELFPELQEKQGLEGYQSARRALKKHEARLLVK